jgi:transposase InsO family protein
MNREIRDYIKTCSPCQFAKAKRQHSAGLLQPKKHGSPGVVSVDIQGPFPRGDGGKEYCLTIKDVFVGNCVLAAMSGSEGGISAQRCVDTLFKDWTCVLGIPRAIITDQGPQFMAELTERFCARLGIDKRRTAVYHPQSNSQAERQHGFQVPLLKALTGHFKRTWPSKLKYVQFAVLTSPQEGRGLPPLEVLTGVKPLLPVDLYAETSSREDEVDRHRYALEHPRDMKKMHAMLNEVREELDAKTKAHYDKSQRDVNYEIGGLCLAFKPVRVKGSQKLQVNFRGPFLILSRIGTVTYRVVLLRDEKKEERKVWPVSVKNMVPFHERVQAVPTTWAEVDAGLPRPSPPPRMKNSAAAAPLRDEEEFESLALEPEEQAALQLRNMTNRSVFFGATNRGVGVFARRDLSASLRLSEYTGERLSHDAHEAKYGGDGVLASYSMVCANGDVIDGADYRVSGWPRYVNAPGPGEQANCVYEEGVGPEAGLVFLVTLRRLEEGEELLADYGQTYVWDAQQPPVDSDDTQRREPPPMVDLSELVWGESRGVADAEASEERAVEQQQDERAEAERMAAYSEEAESAVGEQEQVEAELPSLEVGDLVLVRLEMPPCGLFVAKVAALDELRESAEVQLLGTYGTWQRGKFARSWVDPKDEKQVFSEKPLHRYLEDVATVWSEHIVSPPFTLLKSGRIPTAMVKLAETWEREAGYERPKKRKTGKKSGGGA